MVAWLGELCVGQLSVAWGVLLMDCTALASVFVVAGAPGSAKDPAQVIV